MTTQVDAAKLDAFMGKMVGEMGAAMNAALVLLGDRLGLYKAMAACGAITPRELASQTGTVERNVREWLNAQAAGGIVHYDATSGKYTLPPEHAMALAHEDSPAFIAGAFEVLASLFYDEPKLEKAFKNRGAMGWHEHDACLFRGTERFFRPGYNANLVSNWLPALDGVIAKLQAGAVVADVGCGHGASTILMARSFPESRVFGFDYHAASITAAQGAAKRAGVNGNIAFQVAAAKGFPRPVDGAGYDLVTFFDCLHDMGDPIGASRHVRDVLAPGGTWMIVEPMAGDRVEDNLNPVGRLFYCASTAICTPASLAQEVGMALGAQAGEKRLREVLAEAGFTKVRRSAETPFNMVLEARL